ncbi:MULTISPECIES: hypothetical protein [Legionella]|uniref:Uncharacterized protein n=1 Tax=Legionella drozanskii LLAP-1 TaxID=1212489 RepID=A0A0W0SX36_9GAMM|nr:MULTISPECIES: hypothetical protein [Legionella]KTC87919.1 hypothetical protein Ldro_1538 [Legionella drozanskii LLAP-1]PJE08792.1 MAG: hypothetical protein CK430_11905 [Legionella sp.]
MKKIPLFLLSGLLAFNAQAKENFSCGYKDYFHLDDQIHPGIYIVSAYANAEMDLRVISPRSFEIRDTDRCETGYGHVTVAYDTYNWCVLDVKDGPYMMHPTISASCNGMRYEGLTYDGFNSYSYTIHLS